MGSSPPGEESRVCFVPRISVPLLFTAPHGLWLHRDNHEDHKPEDYTSFLANDFGSSLGASVATWSAEEIAKSKQGGGADPDNRDPNYLHPDELALDPWNLMLEDQLQRCGGMCCHVDFHGRRDFSPGVNDESDCDIGLGAMFERDPTTAKEMKAQLVTELTRALAETPFEVNSHPALQGRGRDGRMTLTQQSSQKGMQSVQIELSLSLRKELNRNRNLRAKFANAIKAALLPGL